MKGFLFIVVTGLLLAGCESYDIMQRSMFSDEDGNMVEVAFGRGEDVHVNYFTSPSNGKKLEFKSRLVVEVELPDGDSFVAWQCMNMLANGTMYRTDDEEWMLLVTGFSCKVYCRNEDVEDRYDEVYRGILCDTAKGDYKEDERWRKLKKNAAGRWE